MGNLKIRGLYLILIVIFAVFLVPVQSNPDRDPDREYYVHQNYFTIAPFEVIDSFRAHVTFNVSNNLATTIHCFDSPEEITNCKNNLSYHSVKSFFNKSYVEFDITFKKQEYFWVFDNRLFDTNKTISFWMETVYTPSLDIIIPVALVGSSLIGLILVLYYRFFRKT